MMTVQLKGEQSKYIFQRVIEKFSDILKDSC